MHFYHTGSEPPMPTALQKLGRYLIVSEIARGGMAHIYRAKLIGVAGFERDVAIKKILPYWSHQQDFINMLIDEAKILVHLQHKNIVPVFELGKEKNNYFIVMEYVSGLDLRRLLSKLKEKNISLPLDLCCYIIKEVCLALDFAHNKENQSGQSLEIVHRDISPQNILINWQGETKLTDFGIAKVQGKTKETATGVLKGKFSYMSPEQALGSSIDHRTDLFALGLVFYELFEGEKYFSGKNDLAILEKVKHGQDPLSKNIPLPLRLLLEKSLQKNTFHRFQTALEFKNAVESVEKKLNLNATSKDLKDFLHFHLKQDIQMFSENEKQIAQQTQIFFTETESDQELTHHKTQQTAILSPEDHTVMLDQTLIEKKHLEKPNTTHTIVDALTVIEQPSTSIKEKNIHPDPLQKPIHLGAVGFACATLSLLLILLNSPKPKAPEYSHDIPLPPTPIQRYFEPLLNLKESEQLASAPPPKTPSPMGDLQSEISINFYPPTTQFDITMNGQTVSHTGNFSLTKSFDQKKTKVNLTAQLEEYLEKKHNFQIDNDHLIHHQSIEMKKITYGQIKVTARPWGTARVKDQSSSKVAPTLFENIPTGKQVISVYYPPKKRAISRTITVTENKTIHCTASFSHRRKYLHCK